MDISCYTLDILDMQEWRAEYILVISCYTLDILDMQEWRAE